MDRPFELTAPVLGLLLVFRTDTANGRFDQGTSAVWEITSSLRSVIRKLVRVRVRANPKPKPNPSPHPNPSANPSANPNPNPDQVIRKLVAWTGKETCTDAERSAALELIDGSLLLHGWIMGSYLRGKG